MDKPSNNQIIQSIFEFFVRNGLLDQSHKILTEVQKMIDIQNGKIIVTVESAVSLTLENKDNIREILSKRYSAKEIVLEEIINESNLGGFKIKAGDEVIDLTLQGKIKQLKKYLTTS